MMDVLRDNPIPSLLLVITAIVGGIVVVIAAISGNTNPGGLTFETYFQTLVAGAVGLGIGRGLKKEGLSTRQEPTATNA